MAEQQSPAELRWQNGAMQSRIVGSILSGNEAASELHVLAVSASGRTELDGLLASTVRGFRARLHGAGKLDSRTSAALDAITTSDRIAVAKALETDDQWDVDGLLEDLVAGARNILATTLIDACTYTVLDIRRIFDADAIEAERLAQRKTRQRGLAHVAVANDPAQQTRGKIERCHVPELPALDSLEGIALMAGLTHGEIETLNGHILGHPIEDAQVLARALKAIGGYFEEYNSSRSRRGVHTKEYEYGYRLATYLFGIGYNRTLNMPQAIAFVVSKIRNNRLETAGEQAITNWLERSLAIVAFKVFKYLAENGDERRTVRQLLAEVQAYRNMRKSLGNEPWGKRV